MAGNASPDVSAYFSENFGKKYFQEIFFFLIDFFKKKLKKIKKISEKNEPIGYPKIGGPPSHDFFINFDMFGL